MKAIAIHFWALLVAIAAAGIGCAHEHRSQPVANSGKSPVAAPESGTGSTPLAANEHESVSGGDASVGTINNARFQLCLGAVVEVPGTGVPTEFAKGTFIELRNVGNGRYQVANGSLLRIDFRSDLSYLDILFPQTIRLGPNVRAPLPYYMMMGKTAFKNARLTAGDEVFIIADKRIGQYVLEAGAQGATLERVTCGDRPCIRLVKGGAEFRKNPDYDAEFAIALGKRAKDGKETTSLTGATGPLSWSFAMGDSFARGYAFDRSRAVKLQVGVAVPGLRAAAAIRGTTTLSWGMLNGEYPAISVESGGLVYLDFRNGKQFWDVFAAETVILRAGVMVPLTFELPAEALKGKEFHGSPLTAKSVLVTLRPDYREAIIVAGEAGAQFERTRDNPSEMRLTGGSALLATATGLDRRTLVPLRRD